MATEAQPAKQAKLLLVEDDVLVRMLLADMLGEIGYTVAAEAARASTRRWKRRGKPTSILRSSTPISKAGPSRRLPMPSSPAT